jgi:hypothetical protein
MAKMVKMEAENDLIGNPLTQPLTERKPDKQSVKIERARTVLLEYPKTAFPKKETYANCNKP